MDDDRHRIGTAHIHRHPNARMGQGPNPGYHLMTATCWCRPLILTVTCTCDEPARHLLDDWDRPAMLPDGRVLQMG